LNAQNKKKAHSFYENEPRRAAKKSRAYIAQFANSLGRARSEKTWQGQPSEAVAPKKKRTK